MILVLWGWADSHVVSHHLLAPLSTTGDLQAWTPSAWSSGPWPGPGSGWRGWRGCRLGVCPTQRRLPGSDRWELGRHLGPVLPPLRLRAHAGVPAPLHLGPAGRTLWGCSSGFAVDSTQICHVYVHKNSVLPGLSILATNRTY